jgi:hypothetical protein
MKPRAAGVWPFGGVDLSRSILPSRIDRLKYSSHA